MHRYIAAVVLTLALVLTACEGDGSEPTDEESEGLQGDPCGDDAPCAIGLVCEEVPVGGLYCVRGPLLDIPCSGDLDCARGLVCERPPYLDDTAPAMCSRPEDD